MEDRESAFQARIQTYAVVNNEHVDLDAFFNEAFITFNARQSHLISDNYIIKTYTVFAGEFVKEVMHGDGVVEEVFQVHYLHSWTQLMDIDTVYIEWYNEYVVDFFKTRIEDMQINGSGWKLSAIIELAVFNNSYEPLRGSSYMKLDFNIGNRGAVINVKNNDEMCFKWAVLSRLHDEEVPRNKQRVSAYMRWQHELNFNGIHFPVSVLQINRFERLNPTISVNCYIYDSKSKKKIVPIRLTKDRKGGNRHVNLLLLQDSANAVDEATRVNILSDDVPIKSHYCWIRNMSRMFASQMTTSNNQIFICERCLHYFYSDDKLKAHIMDCASKNVCGIIMPSDKDKYVSFQKAHHKLRVPFCIYADIESILKPVNAATTAAFRNSAHTSAYQEHEAFSVGLYFKSDINDGRISSSYSSYRGLDCIKSFCDKLYALAFEMKNIFDDPKRMQITELQEKKFQLARTCHICSKDFSELDDEFCNYKVRDHCHITGAYRGPAHNGCNLKFRESRTIPVIFHNLSGYDSHFIIHEIANRFAGEINIIASTDQNYVSFTKTVSDTKPYGVNFRDIARNTIKFKFIDSFRFMGASLDALSSILPSDKKTILRDEFVDLTPQQLNMLERKGVFPYDYVDSWEKLEVERLPEKDLFYSQLTETHISDEDYHFAKTVWDAFNIKNIGEYADLYMKTDILLLADIYENFRNCCLKIYELDPAHYYTLPGFSWDAMLKHTNVKIELLTDVNMLLFVERGIRGGISQCSKRHAKANNKYMGESYDPTKPSSYLIYLDVNNLYGHAMTDYLPLNNFQWHENMDTDAILDMVKKNPTIGCIIEADLKYGQELHDQHSDYPLCGESMRPPRAKYAKLLLTLHDKKKYIMHHKTLELVLREGMQVERVHRVLTFTQRKWLKSYIELNTEKRTLATNDFEKKLYKDMSNVIFGKSMEDVRKHSNIRLVMEWEGRYGVQVLVASPRFKKRTVFAEKLVAIEMLQTEIIMDKPIIIGMCVLEISKLCMYEFHYRHMLQKYGDKSHLLYTDTDSFIYEITDIDDIYEDMKADIHKYDTSDYYAGNPFNMPQTNKKVPGLMKDECNGRIMTEFCGLRSKMYSIRVDGIDAIKKAKGVKKYALKKRITFQHYIDCIEQNCIITLPQNTIRSRLHNVFSINQKKVALSPFDDKRHILENKIETLPWGHYKINL